MGFILINAHKGADRIGSMPYLVNRIYTKSSINRKQIIVKTHP